jgi:thiamine-phosphate pyrophosphorylase
MVETHTGLRGLYAITDAGLQAPELLCERVAQAIDGGAAVIQYRDKSGDARRRLTQARALAGLCQARGALLIVNDDVALAADSGADGVHLGRDDSTVAAARRRLGDTAIIGVSCYNRLALAQQAVEQGADYLAFGRFFTSQTKPDAVQADSTLVVEAKRRWTLPVAVIGGITPYNAAALLAAGADMLAVVRGVFAAADVRAAASAYAALFADAPATDTSAAARGAARRP